MKQRPYPHQVYELSEKAQVKFRESWIPESTDIICRIKRDQRYKSGVGFEVYQNNTDDDGQDIVTKDSKADYLLLPSIGQMIEFIEDQFVDDLELETGYGESSMFKDRFGKVTIEYDGKRNIGYRSIKILCIGGEEGIQNGYISKIDREAYWEDELVRKFGTEEMQSNNLSFEAGIAKRDLLYEHFTWGADTDLCNALWEACKYILEDNNEV